MEKSSDTILIVGKKHSKLFFWFSQDGFIQIELKKKKGELVFVKCISMLRPTLRHLFMFQGWKMKKQKSLLPAKEFCILLNKYPHRLQNSVFVSHCRIVSQYKIMC